MIMDNSIDMGSSANDLYLIKKLKESGITIEKLNNYMRKIFLVIKDTGRQVEYTEECAKQTIRPIF